MAVGHMLTHLKLYFDEKYFETLQSRAPVNWFSGVCHVFVISIRVGKLEFIFGKDTFNTIQSGFSGCHNFFQSV